MGIQNELDKAIKKYEKENYGIESGFEIKGKSPNPDYLSNKAWDKFYDDMARYNINALKRYSDGAGGEMKPYKHKGNEYPPKMASFGSSSRMIYNLVMKDEVKERFLFEEKLSTTVGGIANLDGFMQKDNTYIFVEAKCREPYSEEIKHYGKKYETLFESITEYAIKNTDKLCLSCDCNSVICQEKGKSVEKLEVTFKVGDKIINHFDMKQMICHLLAVGTAVLTNHYDEMKNAKDEDTKLHFIYLIYDPRNLDFKDDVQSGEKIMKIYNDIFSFCEGNENQFFKDLFKVILEFLQTKKNLGTDKDILKIVDNFTFHICSQEDFKKKCESLLQ